MTGDGKAKYMGREKRFWMCQCYRKKISPCHLLSGETNGIDTQDILVVGHGVVDRDCKQVKCYREEL